MVSKNVLGEKQSHEDQGTQQTCASKKVLWSEETTTEMQNAK